MQNHHGLARKGFVIWSCSCVFRFSFFFFWTYFFSWKLHESSCKTRVILFSRKSKCQICQIRKRRRLLNSLFTSIVSIKPHDLNWVEWKRKTFTKSMVRSQFVCLIETMVWSIHSQFVCSLVEVVRGHKKLFLHVQPSECCSHSKKKIEISWACRSSISRLTITTVKRDKLVQKFHSAIVISDVPHNILRLTTPLWRIIHNSPASLEQTFARSEVSRFNATWTHSPNSERNCWKSASLESVRNSSGPLSGDGHKNGMLNTRNLSTVEEDAILCAFADGETTNHFQCRLLRSLSFSLVGVNNS
jgi:hypothetical protein